MSTSTAQSAPVQARPSRTFVGNGRHPVVVIDDATGEVRGLRAIATALAPFPPPVNSLYPGVRRILAEDDQSAWAYLSDLLAMLAPYIAGGFDIDRFRLVEASFSVVTRAPSSLTPPQRIPHFDSTQPGLLAIMHHLHELPGCGTAFYRQRMTGIERVDAGNISAFLAAAGPSAKHQQGYINGSTDAYECMGSVDSRMDRVVIYPAALLHSGIIPATLPLDADPRIGRLTANFFIQAC